MDKADRQADRRGSTRRLGNLFLLVGGFGVGQGSIFLAQTYLVATGQTGLLALFGTHFSFAMLGIIVVEAGSLTILSSRIARLLVENGARDALWRGYWETTVFRITMAVVLISATCATLLFVPLPAYSAAYALAALPGFAVWAFNGAGFLDGLQKSGISGISGSIAYVASAASLMLSVGEGPETAGLISGAALSLGYMLTVGVQFAALAAAGWRPQFVTPSANGIRSAFIEETSLLMGLLPGQLYFRGQLAIASIFLGTNATAILVYAKQIVGAASQIAGFARRIEFPRMVQAVAKQPATSTAALVGIQKLSLAIAALLFGGIVAASGVVILNFDGFTVAAWTFLAIFSVTILTESVGQSLVQAMFARNLYHSAALVRIAAVLVALVACYLLVNLTGQTAFIIGDLLSHVLVISLSLFWLQRTMTRHAQATA